MAQFEREDKEGGVLLSFHCN